MSVLSYLCPHYIIFICYLWLFLLCSLIPAHPNTAAYAALISVPLSILQISWSQSCANCHCTVCKLPQRPTDNFGQCILLLSRCILFVGCHPVGCHPMGCHPVILVWSMHLVVPVPYPVGCPTWFLTNALCAKKKSNSDENWARDIYLIFFYMRWILSCQKTKKWSFVLFRPNLPQLRLFHPYLLCKSCFRVISMIKMVIWDQSKAISLILKKIKSKFQKSEICT